MHEHTNVYKIKRKEERCLISVISVTYNSAALLFLLQKNAFSSSILIESEPSLSSFFSKLHLSKEAQMSAKPGVSDIFLMFSLQCSIKINPAQENASKTASHKYIKPKNSNNPHTCIIRKYMRKIQPKITTPTFRFRKAHLFFRRMLVSICS